MIDINELNNQILQTYSKNLNYLEKKEFKLFQKINNLSKKIDDGTYIEKFILELKEDSYFDIKDIEKDTFFYGHNSYIDAHIRLNQANFNKNEFTYNILSKDSTRDKFTLENFEDNIKPLIEFSNEHIKSENFTNIEKMIFIGTGLGIHIIDIVNKLNISSILIVEPSLEIFRLSLFLVDYSLLDNNNKKLFLNISTEDQDRKNKVYNFFNYNPNTNYIFKYELLKQNYSPISDEIYRLLSTISPYIFSYKHKSQGYQRTIKYLNEGYRFLKSDLEEIQLLKNKPVLILSGGPSLDKNIQWIKDNQNSFFIVSINIILSKLEEYSITPDLVICIDPSQIVKASFEKIKNISFLNSTPIVFISQVHPDVIDTIKDLDKNNIYMVQLLEVDKNLKTAAQVGNVGTYAFNLLVKFGAKKIYLLGNDAAFEQDSGAMYTKGTSVFNRDIDLNSQNNSTTKDITKDDIFILKGNFSDTVQTTRLLYNIKDNYEKACRDLKKNYSFQAYNLSDGLYMEGLEPKEVSKVTIGENINNKSIKFELEQNSTIHSIKIKEEDNIQYSIIKNELIEFIKNDIDNIRNLIEKRDQLILLILNTLKDLKNKIYIDILISYESLIGVHLNYMLNMEDINILDEKEINHIKNLWANGIVKINKAFMNDL